MVLARIDSVVEGRPGPQVVSFADASHLARLAGQLVDVLGHVQVRLGWNLMQAMLFVGG